MIRQEKMLTNMNKSQYIRPPLLPLQSLRPATEESEERKNKKKESEEKKVKKKAKKVSSNLYKRKFGLKKPKK